MTGLRGFILRKPTGTDFTTESTHAPLGISERRERKLPQQCTKVIFLPEMTSCGLVPCFAIKGSETQTTYTHTLTHVESKGERRSLSGSENAKIQSSLWKNKSVDARPRCFFSPNFNRPLSESGGDLHLQDSPPRTPDPACAPAVGRSSATTTARCHRAPESRASTQVRAGPAKAPLPNNST